MDQFDVARKMNSGDTFFVKATLTGGMSFLEARIFYYKHIKEKGRHMCPLREYGYVEIPKKGKPASKVHKKPICRSGNVIKYLRKSHDMKNEFYIFETEDEMMRDLFIRTNM